MIQKKCIYCGSYIENEKKMYVLKIKGEMLDKVYCCSKDCYQKTKDLNKSSESRKKKLSIVLFLCIISNVLIVTKMDSNKLMYIPMGIMGIAIYFWPYLLVRFRSYQRLGIMQTLNTMKKAGLIIAVLAIFFLLTT